MREDAAIAKLIVYGTLANPRVGQNTTDMDIAKVLRKHDWLGEKKQIVIPRYVPFDPKDPPKYLILCDIYKDRTGQEKLDPFRAFEVKSPALLDYVEGLLAIDPTDHARVLRFCFDYLDHSSTDVATDAFLEFAKSNDRQVGEVAGKLSAEKIRQWLQDPRTPANRLSLFAFLLGACGSDKDALVLKDLLDKRDERMTAALDGLLSGYIHLRPRQGWDLALEICREEKKPFTERFAIVRALRFYHGWKPEESKKEILACHKILLDQGDIADVVIEDLRKWKVWDLTPEVLALFDRETHNAPIMRRGIVRFALCCPNPEARRFITELKKKNAELVDDVAESLKFEAEDRK